MQDARKDLLQMDFEGILKYFRVTMPKRYMEEERYKQLLASALNIKVNNYKKNKIKEN